MMRGSSLHGWCAHPGSQRSCSAASAADGLRAQIRSGRRPGLIFVGYPSCMLYAGGSDLRLRVRATRAAAVCRTLSRELARFGFRWSLHGRGPRRIVSPIWLFADPRGQVELQVIDDAGNSRHGGRIFANLAHDGWFDLGG